MCCSCARDVYYNNIVMKTIKEEKQIVGERWSNSCSVSEKEKEKVEETEKEKDEEEEEEESERFNLTASPNIRLVLDA